MPVLKKLLAASSRDFMDNYELTLAKLKKRLVRREQLFTLEDILFEIMENGNEDVKERVRKTAYYFGLPEKCLFMIRERLTGNIAIGCRKAGLYRYEAAIPDIIKVLDIVSSETQFQALMALARIGKEDAMVEAFEKIHRLILVNERAVNETLNNYIGDRVSLYKRMIHHESEYLVRLFLKAIDREIASKLIDDIIKVTENGGKEARLAGIVAIGRSGVKKKIPRLTKALRDEEWEIRAMAAKTLGILTDQSALKPLAKAARDREWWVRQNAVNSLLSYSNCGDILVSIANTGDKFAYDSMLFTLEKEDQQFLLTRIKEAWLDRPNNDTMEKSVI
jgi:HEAT repeat protein